MESQCVVGDLHVLGVVVPVVPVVVLVVVLVVLVVRRGGEAADEPAGGLRAEVLDGLGDRGEVEGRGEFVTVEPDDGDVLRAAQPERAQRPQRAEGHLVGLAEQRGRGFGVPLSRSSTVPAGRRRA